METFHYLLMANHMVFQKKVLEKLKMSGLTSGQPKVLDYLREHDGASQKEIAAACHIEAGSLTSVLNRMEEKGMIERKNLNGNRRTFHIFMTETGRTLQQKVDETFAELEEEMFGKIPEAEREQFMQTFEKIYMNLWQGDKHE